MVAINWGVNSGHPKNEGSMFLRWRDGLSVWVKNDKTLTLSRQTDEKQRVSAAGNSDSNQTGEGCQESKGGFAAALFVTLVQGVLLNILFR